MNSIERFKARLSGEKVDRVPNFDILMAFAARRTGKPLRSYYLDHRVLVEANLRALDDFDLDIVQAISDPYREAADWGLEVEFPEESIPVAKKPLIDSLEKLSGLRPIVPVSGRRMNDRIEAVRLMKEKTGGQVPVLGWVEGALAEAADLRGVSTLMTDLTDHPEWVQDLLERCVEQAIAFARAQIEAGADIIGLGDAVGSQISPRMYRQFALPYEQRIFAAVHTAGAAARLHICGNTTRLLGDMQSSGADIVDLDWMVDLKKASELWGDDGPAPCGNFDPVSIMLQGNPKDVEGAVVQTLSAGGARLFSAGGCEIPEGTPVENMRAQQFVLKNFCI